jgi:hypothetical protein
VAVVKELFLTTRIASQASRVVEPELDMNRFQPRQSSSAGVFRQFIAKLLPSGQGAVRSPMRSIARELEEVWPAREL